MTGHFVKGTIASLGVKSPLILQRTRFGLHLVVLVYISLSRQLTGILRLRRLRHRAVVDVIGPRLAGKVVRLLEECAIWLQQEVRADDLAELFFAHLVQPLDLLAGESTNLLDDLLLAVAHGDILCHVAARNVDVYVDVAVVDEHRLVRGRGLCIAGHHVRALLGRLLRLRSLWLAPVPLAFIGAACAVSRGAFPLVNLDADALYAELLLLHARVPFAGDG